MPATSHESTAPAARFQAVTPSNTTKLNFITRGVYVGGAGDLTVLGEDDDVVTFSGVPAGTILPINIKRVNATNTTATLIVAMT